MDEKLKDAILAAREAGQRALLLNRTNETYAEAVKSSLEKSGYMIERKLDLQRFGYLPKDDNKGGFHAG